MKILDYIALALLIVGGLNWGLVGLFDFNLVAELFGEASGLSRTIYTLVGLSGLWTLASVLPAISHSRDFHGHHTTV